MSNSDIFDLIQRDLDYYKEKITPKCPVCLEILDISVITTPCKHKFHTVCLQGWIDSLATNCHQCPVCRADICEKKKDKIPLNINPLGYICPMI